MKGYSVSPRAKADLDEIWTYLATKASFAIADRVLSSIREVFERVSRQPEIGSRVGDRSPGLRFVMAGNYVVLYEIEKHKPRIRRVLHGARDLSQFFGPENDNPSR